MKSTGSGRFGNELAKSRISIRLPRVRDSFRRITGRPSARVTVSNASEGRGRASFSVVIPCHNYAEYLDVAISSAVAQEGVEVEVVIVDDASTDGSREIAARWAQQDSRVRLLVHEENRGHIATFNEALDAATADFVVKLDADDVLTPGSLRRSADLFEANPNVVLVYGGVEHVRGPLPLRTPDRVRGWKVWQGEDWLSLLARLPRNPISQPEVVMRRSTLIQVGGHRPELPGTSDLHLWLRFASAGDVGYIRGAVQGLYRIHDASMRATIHSGLLHDVRVRRDAFEMFISENANDLRDPATFANTVHGALAQDAVTNAFLDFEAGRDPRPLLAEAREIDAKVVKTTAWRSIVRRMNAGGPGGIGSWSGRLQRDVAARLRWYRHRYRGV